ncbi:MAG: hypothetical protein JRH18_17375 [Deltaproteobacteria bacterium]|nr:hypothetical protein [Deltaproteobacteria bacterium]MBW1960406.1 hypothetical protein [Deltaproteobacteria bacterium]MBW2153428.1 hypothetical protein [Deltaproteobacteria bacterium]
MNRNSEPYRIAVLHTPSWIQKGERIPLKLVEAIGLRHRLRPNKVQIPL